MRHFLKKTIICHDRRWTATREDSIYLRKSVVCNAGADKIAAMVGDTSFTIKPRLGEYLLLHKDQGTKANATLFPAPGPLGKGVLVQGTLWGNLILGPTARDVHNPGAEEITVSMFCLFVQSLSVVQIVVCHHKKVAPKMRSLSARRAHVREPRRDHRLYPSEMQGARAFFRCHSGHPRICWCVHTGFPLHATRGYLS